MRKTGPSAYRLPTYDEAATCGGMPAGSSSELPLCPRPIVLVADIGILAIRNRERIQEPPEVVRAAIDTNSRDERSAPPRR